MSVPDGPTERSADINEPSDVGVIGATRWSGWLILGALVLSCAVALLWPVDRGWGDPFGLEKTSLLGLVGLTMFCLGLSVKNEELYELRRRPMTVFLGVALQCTLMPLLAWCIVRSLGLEGPIAYGVLLCGCVPGAMASNVLTMTARGNVSYSVSLTCVATMLSPITVPLALTVIAGVRASSEVFDPVSLAEKLLMTVVLPVIAGYVLKTIWHPMRKVAAHVAAPLATVALLWIIASVVAGNRDRLEQVDAGLVFALLIMNLCGYAGGRVVAQLAKMPPSMSRALTLEIGMQNAGLGTALAASIFESDPSAQIPTAAYTFGCMLTGTLLAAFWASRSSPSGKSSSSTAEAKKA